MYSISEIKLIKFAKFAYVQKKLNLGSWRRKLYSHAMTVARAFCSSFK